MGGDSLVNLGNYGSVTLDLVAKHCNFARFYVRNNAEFRIKTEQGYF